MGVKQALEVDLELATLGTDSMVESSGVWLLGPLNARKLPVTVRAVFKEL